MTYYYEIYLKLLGVTKLIMYKQLMKMKLRQSNKILC